MSTINKDYKNKEILLEKTIDKYYNDQIGR